MLQGTAPVPAEGVLPDGCPEVVLSFGDPFRHLPSAGGPVEQPSVMLVGQITTPMVICGTGRTDLLGMRFRPAGAHALLELPMETVRNGFIGLADAAPRWVGIRERLGDDRDPGHRVAVLQALLREQVGNTPARSPVTSAVELVWSSLGRAPVDRVARKVGLSPRQLSRRFRREVGIGPKTLARIRRFQHFLGLASGRAPQSLARAAVRAGYFDQAHLTRDFNELAGSSPGRFLGGIHHLADLFTEADLRDGSRGGTPHGPTEARPPGRNG